MAKSTNYKVDLVKYLLWDDVRVLGKPRPQFFAWNVKKGIFNHFRSSFGPFKIQQVEMLFLNRVRAMLDPPAPIWLPRLSNFVPG